MSSILRALYDSAGDPSSNTPPFRKGELLRLVREHDSGWIEIITTQRLRGYVSPAWVEKVSEEEAEQLTRAEAQNTQEKASQPAAANGTTATDSSASAQSRSATDPDPRNQAKPPLERRATDWGGQIPESLKKRQAPPQPQQAGTQSKPGPPPGAPKPVAAPSQQQQQQNQQQEEQRHLPSGESDSHLSRQSSVSSSAGQSDSDGSRPGSRPSFVRPAPPRAAKPKLVLLEDAEEQTESTPDDENELDGSIATASAPQKKPPPKPLRKPVSPAVPRKPGSAPAANTPRPVKSSTSQSDFQQALASKLGLAGPPPSLPRTDNIEDDTENDSQPQASEAAADNEASHSKPAPPRLPSASSTGSPAMKPPVLPQRRPSRAIPPAPSSPQEKELQAADTVSSPAPVVEEDEQDDDSAADASLRASVFTDNSLVETFEKKQLLENGRDAKSRRWQRVCVRLVQSQLRVYSTEKDMKKGRKPILTMGLADKEARVASDYSKKDNCFEVGNDVDRIMLQAHDEETMKYWIAAISTACERAAFEDDDQDTIDAPPSPKSGRSRNRRSTIKEDRAVSPTSRDGGVRKRLNRFLRSRPKKQDLVSKGIIEDAVFGGTIEHQVEKEQGMAVSPGVPLVITKCISYIDNHLKEQGIYRVSGNSAQVQSLVAEANQDIDKFHFAENEDVHAVTGLLKLYFRELAEPAFTDGMYEEFIAAGRTDDAEDRQKQLKKLVKRLPDSHRATLAVLFEHLQRVAEHGGVNKMHLNNLSIVFGPTLLRSSEQSMESIIMDAPYQTSVVEELMQHIDWL